jgi:DNA helicase HerA-like ATPase
MSKDKFQIRIGELAESREPLYLDLRKLVETRALIEASSGGGKSTLMRLIAERAAGVVQTIILDHEDEFPTLRNVLDVLLVGDGRDVPISVESAPLLARRLAETRISAVINLFDLPIKERREYVGAFLTELLSLKKDLWHPMFVMLDEAHIYAPEKGNEPSRAPVVNMMSQGRKREYCEIVATQRFSKIDKDAIADAKNVFIGGTFLDVDQKRAGDMLGKKTSEYSLLRDMATGEWYAFGQALVSSQRGVLRFYADKPQTEKPKSGTKILSYRKPPT